MVHCVYIELNGDAHCSLCLYDAGLVTTMWWPQPTAVRGAYYSQATCCRTGRAKPNNCWV